MTDWMILIQYVFEFLTIFKISQQNLSHVHIVRDCLSDYKFKGFFPYDPNDGSSL